jgi:integrase
MSINRICTVCKRTFQLTTLTCSNCRANLTKFKVRVKRSGHWNTLQTESLDEAQQFQSKFTEREALREALQHQLSFQGPLRGVDSRVDSSGLSESQIPSTSSGPTLREVFNSFMAWAETHKRSWKSDQQLFELRLSPLGSLTLSRITPEMIQTLIDNMIPQRKGKAKQRQRLAPATKLQAAALVRRLFNWAKKRRMWAGENPVSFIELEKVDNSRSTVLDSDGVQRLLEALSSHPNTRMSLIIMACLWTGRRVGELKGLSWGCVDLDRGIVTPLRTKSGKKQTFVLNSKAMEVFTEAYSCRLGELVFPNAEGKLYGNLNACWSRFRNSYGFPGLWIHDLRRTAITLWAEAGLNPQTIMALSGHETLQVMMRYTRISTEAARKASERICEGFSSPQE